MKKTALFVALLLVLGAVPGWSISATVDGFLDRRAESDLRPVQDSAKVLIAVNDLADKSLEKADPILKHRKPVMDPLMKSAKYIINTPYDLIRRMIPMHRDAEKK